ANAVLVHSPEFYGAVRERCCYLPQQGTETLFEVALRRWISRDVARSRLAPPRTDSPQPAPAHLTAYSSAKTVADPGGHGASTPPIAAWSWPRESVAQFLLLLFRE
ncbi:MAG TPA: hypothetical protein VGP82_17920, partial [Ktedonobacterales bacterium]|nr:hypothetical protein [Ktedonobacterales bacterium]